MSQRVRLMLLSAFVLCAAGTALSWRGPVSYAAQDAPLSPLELATSTQSSYNWAGWVADNGRYTAVSATWVVPQVASGGSSFAADATWVGVGGVDQSDLIQAGTQALVDQDDNTRFEAWYEALPQVSEPLALEVNPGDSVTAAVTYLGSAQWRVMVLNNTTGKSAAITVAYGSSFSSAEWIEEMPATDEGGSFIPLDDFGTLGFRSARAVKDGVSVTPQGAGAQPLRMVSTAGRVLAAPSVLTDTGGFTVSRSDAPAVARVRRPLRVIYMQF